MQGRGAAHGDDRGAEPGTGGRSEAPAGVHGREHGPGQPGLHLQALRVLGGVHDGVEHARGHDEAREDPQQPGRGRARTVPGPRARPGDVEDETGRRREQGDGHAAGEHDAAGAEPAQDRRGQGPGERAAHGERDDEQAERGRVQAERGLGLRVVRDERAEQGAVRREGGGDGPARATGSGDAVVGGREVRRGLAHASQPSRRQTSAQPAKIFALYSTPSWLGLANRTQSAAATASSAASFSATSSADPA